MIGASSGLERYLYALFLILVDIDNLVFVYVAGLLSQTSGEMAERYNPAVGADLLERIHRRRMEVQQTRQAIFWTTVNFFIAAILCFDM